MTRKLLCAFLFVIMACSASCAAISRDVVNAAWERVAKADGFKVIPITYETSDSPNAWVKFQSQNNFSVHVTEGLMRILNSESEIAGVLGHEIGHVKLGHYGKGVGRKVGWAALGMLIGRAVGGGTAGAITQTAGNVAMNLAESGFSREQEVEADDYGTELLVRAGYPSDGLYRAMMRFKANNYVTAPSGFNSHPPTERRLQHLKEKSASLKKAKR